MNVQNLALRDIGRCTSPSLGAYVTPKGATEADPETQKRPADSRNFSEEIASVCRSRPAYSRSSPI